MDSGSDRFCENCGRWIEPNETLYRMRLEIVAKPPGPEPIDLTPGEDVRAELADLLARMEAMGDDEVAEATEQVHEVFAFTLCPACRNDVHGRIKARRQFIV